MVRVHEKNVSKKITYVFAFSFHNKASRKDIKNEITTIVGRYFIRLQSHRQHFHVCRYRTCGQNGIKSLKQSYVTLLLLTNMNYTVVTLV